MATGAPEDCSCYIKQLPERLENDARKVAKNIFPANAPGNFRLPEGVLAPQQLAVMTTKYWGPTPRTLTVRFMEFAPMDLQQRILSHMNAWNCGITFVLVSDGHADVRISLTGSGFWSYLGTDITLVPDSQPTMNLQGFSMSTSDSEFHRVVRHETGHTLGFPHEHLRQEVVNNIDRGQAYDYFRRTYGWPPAMVDNNVLVPLEQSKIMGTPVDVTSIMAYQLPGEIMKDGIPVPGGVDINWSDFTFCQRIYPRYIQAGQAPAVQPSAVENWGPEHDVNISAQMARFMRT
jgi:hypothetical protein